MDLSLQFEDIFCYEASPGVVSTHEESLETAIPEYCPDMARIVDTVGRLTIRERQLTEAHCTVSGSVKVTVLYTSEEAVGLRSLSVSVPFSCVLDDRSLAGCGTLFAEGRVLLAEARAVTSRKLYVKVMPEITVTGYRAVKRRIACGVQDGAAICTRRQKLELSLLTAVSEKGFSFTDDVLLDNGCTPEDILLHRVCPAILSAQRLGNKLMVKGEMQLCVLYRDDGQTLRQYDAALPFSQILDVAELLEDAEYTLCPQIGECDIRVMRTDSGSGFGLTPVWTSVCWPIRAVPLLILRICTAPALTRCWNGRILPFRWRSRTAAYSRTLGCGWNSMARSRSSASPPSTAHRQKRFRRRSR